MTAIAPVRAEILIEGVPVRCEVETDYPFEDGYRVRVTTARPVHFALELRIPGFASGAKVNGAAAEPGVPFRAEREWSGETVISVSLNFEMQYLPRPSGMFCLRRGALLFALPVAENWTPVE